MLSKRITPGFYRLAKKMRPVLPYGILANLLQWISRDIHETDFEIFECLAGTRGLVLDVGASRGQSALSILRRTRRLRVFSIEPNRKHRWSLLLIRLLHPWRFSFRLVAAANDSSSKTLYVPGRRASGLSAQGSLDPAEFSKDYVQQRLAASGFDAGDMTAFRRLQVRAVRLDSFGLEPDLIKLDVEGFEGQALKGLARTLDHRLPALLVEFNNPQRWLPLLEAMGYDFYRYEPSTRSLQKYDDRDRILNLFCLNKNSHCLISKILLGKVNTQATL